MRLGESIRRTPPSTVNTFGATNIKLNTTLGDVIQNECVKGMSTSEKGK